MPVRYVCDACGAETTVGDNVACLSCPECGGKVRRTAVASGTTGDDLPEEDRIEERDDRTASKEPASDDTPSGPVAESHSSGGAPVTGSSPVAPVKGLRVARPVKGLGGAGQPEGRETGAARPVSSDMPDSEAAGKAEREEAREVLREAREQSEREAEEILRQAREKAEADSRALLERAREEASKEREGIIAAAEESARKSLHRAQQRADEQARTIIEKARAVGQEAESEARRIREQAVAARSKAEEGVADQIAQKADEILDEARAEAEGKARQIVQAAEERARKIMKDAEHSSEIAAEAAEASVAAEADKLARKTLLDAEQKAGEVLKQAEEKAAEILEDSEQKAGEVLKQAEEKAGEVLEQARAKAGEIAAEVETREESDNRSEETEPLTSEDETQEEMPEEIDLNIRQKKIARNVKRRVTGFTLLTSIAGGTVLYFIILLNRGNLSSGFKSSAMLLLLVQFAVFVWVFVSMWKLFFESHRRPQTGTETRRGTGRSKIVGSKKSRLRRSTGSRTATTSAGSINARIAKDLAAARSSRGLVSKPGSPAESKKGSAAEKADVDQASGGGDAAEEPAASEEHTTGETKREKDHSGSGNGTDSPPHESSPEAVK